MDDRLLVTCVTDLKDSTTLNQKLGNRKFASFTKNHLSIGKSLAKLSDGKYIKDVGDAHVVTFESPQDAIYFALRMQEYCTNKPCLSRISIGLRISLYLGTVELVDEDVFGSGIIQATRTESKADAGQIIVNKLLLESIIDTWGEERATKYFIYHGEHELKRIIRPPRQKFFLFNWQLYGEENPHDGQPKLVFDHLHQGKVETSYVGIKDLSKPGFIIWPVVPRGIVNTIHKGQAEVIRLLVVLGWRVHLLIADCGSLNAYDNIDPIVFCKKLKKYIATRGIEKIETSYLSEYYKSGSPDYNRTQEIFRTIISDLTLQDFLHIVNKGYTDRVIKDNILRRPILDCLRPVLSLAAVLHLAQKTSQKSIIVAGADERRQWERAYDIPNTRDQIGVLMIPVLGEDDEDHQILLSKAGPIWPSPDSLIRDLTVSNTAWWTFHLHAFIPEFPATFVEISGNTMTPQEWHDPKRIPEKIRKEDLAQKVWTFLDPDS